MFNVKTPDTKIDGISISTKAEKLARVISNVILILGILIAVWWIAKGYYVYLDEKYDTNTYRYAYYHNKSRLITDIIIPHALTAFYQLVVAVFASMALKLFANMSLSIKARAFACGENEGNVDLKNSSDELPQQNVNGLS